MALISAHCGRSGGVMACQDLPPSRLMCTSPSAEPAHNSRLSRGDTARADTSGKTSALDWSRSIGPPLGASVEGSLRVRSGLIVFQLRPESVLSRMTCEAMSSSFGSSGEERMGPAEAVFLLSGGGAFQIVRPGTDVAVLPGREVVAQEDTEITAAIGDVRVPRLRSDEGALAVGDPAPVAGGNHTLGGCARALEGALVLLRAVDMEGKLLIQRHVVELARGLVVL